MIKEDTHMLVSPKWETIDICHADSIQAARVLFQIKGHNTEHWNMIIEIKTGQIERF